MFFRNRDLPALLVENRTTVTTSADDPEVPFVAGHAAVFPDQGTFLWAVTCGDHA
jgi:hypothetical protein